VQTILKKITNRIKQDEKENFYNFSAADFVLRERPEPIDVLALMEREFFVIAETKKGSPSKGVICEDYDPAAIAGIYQETGASSVSVITEKNFFFGSKDHLPLVKQTVSLPVLRKDFLIHPYQVYESYNLGADFVLLIAACLTGYQLEKMYRLTLSLDMQALIEVHTEKELERVLKLKPAIIGINNRDLRTFKVDISTSYRLKKMIPEDIFVISESGVQSNEDITALKTSGFSGVLIGEYLLRLLLPPAGKGALFEKTAPLHPPQKLLFRRTVYES
jgi:indole-3-glycerol phosphate synthase